MIQLVYISSNVKPFTDEELLQLLDKSRQNYEKRGITAMLLHKDGDFIPALESDDVLVRSLSAQIAQGPWHRDVSTLPDGRCIEREFPDWSMGFRDLNDMDARDAPSYSTFLDSPLRALAVTQGPARCRELLLPFKNKPNGGHPAAPAGST